MKISTFFLLIASCSIIACSSLPQVYPAGDSDGPQLKQTCRRPFPNGKWQFLHSIETTMPGGHKGFVMGLTIISASDKSARSVMMTMEGLVIFDAQYDGQITIQRAIPPFDSEDFAEGLIEDIKLIFFEPTGPLIEIGFLKNGSSICRYQNPYERIVDIITSLDQTWEIRQYNHDLRLDRTVKGIQAKSTGPGYYPGITQRIELTAYGASGYALVMDLVEAIPLTK